MVDDVLKSVAVVYQALRERVCLAARAGTQLSVEVLGTPLLLSETMARSPARVPEAGGVAATKLTDGLCCECLGECFAHLTISVPLIYNPVHIQTRW